MTVLHLVRHGRPLVDRSGLAREWALLIDDDVIVVTGLGEHRWESTVWYDDSAVACAFARPDRSAAPGWEARVEDWLGWQMPDVAVIEQV